MIADDGGADDDGLAGLAEALERTTSWLRRTSRPTEWSAAALSTLDALSRGRPRRVSDLVAAERISQPGMTGLIARMEAAGLVERSSDPTDGRATLVSLTASGRAYIEELHARRAANLAVYLRALPAPSRTALAGAVDALTTLASLPISEEDV